MSDQKVIRPSISPDESWLVTRKCLEPLWSPNELTGITLGPWWIPMSDQEEPVTLSSPHECPWVSISSDEPCESIWAPMGHGEWPGNVYMDQSETQMSDHGLPSDPWRVPSASNPMMPMAKPHNASQWWPGSADGPEWVLESLDESWWVTREFLRPRINPKDFLGCRLHSPYSESQIVLL